ncbi:hypothetical protein GUJ93_ZPchr0001g33160 [Zizania palustris]|uniref:Uncharacterized protein n=1 Tax=Zizania palustris TaxID=103762 RepID=A0A8J5S7K7_ZIZPA|nr:hypothetical protein GUJ93_ZPchr0001g33160 [Zizania palustris]
MTPYVKFATSTCVLGFWSVVTMVTMASSLAARIVISSTCCGMDILYQCKEILKIQKFRRMVSYAGFYCFTALVTYAYTSNTKRAGISNADQYYASYPAGTELLTDTAKLYKAALGNCFEIDDWGPIEFSIMAKHFDRQGKPPYAYHAQYMAHLLSHGQLDGSG